MKLRGHTSGIELVGFAKPFGYARRRPGAIKVARLVHGVPIEIDTEMRYRVHTDDYQSKAVVENPSTETVGKQLNSFYGRPTYHWFL